jgi:hypothetical protein
MVDKKSQVEHDKAYGMNARTLSQIEAYEAAERRELPPPVGTPDDRRAELHRRFDEPKGKAVKIIALDDYNRILEALTLADTTILRLQTRHGPFGNADGTLDVIRAALKLVVGG